MVNRTTYRNVFIVNVCAVPAAAADWSARDACEAEDASAAAVMNIQSRQAAVRRRLMAGFRCSFSYFR